MMTICYTGKTTETVKAVSVSQVVYMFIWRFGTYHLKSLRWFVEGYIYKWFKLFGVWGWTRKRCTGT